MAETTNNPIAIDQEEEREELIYQLLQQFQESIGSAFNEEKKFSFIAGARSALYMVFERGIARRPLSPATEGDG